MATSYTSLLGLALPVQGELSGTWGNEVNNYITNYVDAAVAGTQLISGSQTAVTLSVTNGVSLSQAAAGATGSAQYQIIRCSGNPASLLTITAPAASKVYLVINDTSTAQSVKLVGTGPTAGVTMVTGERAVCAWNGSDFVKVASSTADGVTTIDFGTTGLTPATATSGAVTVAGTLAVANGGTGITSFGSGIATFLGTPSSANLAAALTDETGSGSAVFATSPTLVTPNLGTPTTLVLSSATSLPLSSGVTGILPIANGGTATATPALVQGTGVTITGTWPNQTINATGTGGTVTSVAVSGGTTGLTTSGGPITTSGTITLAGTVATTNGGTGLTSFTSGGVVYASSSSALATGSGLVFDGNNLGLGVTPSVWSSASRPALQLTNGAALFSRSGSTFLGQNFFYNSSDTGTYIANGFATLYNQTSGQHQWFNAASGTAGNAASLTQAMTLDVSGNLLVGGTAARGTTAGAAHLDLFNGTAPAGTLTNGVSLYSSSGDLKFMNAAGDAFDVGYRNIPQNAQSGNYTLTLADSGDHIYHALGDGAATYTIPANSSVAYPIGTAVTFVNMSATSISIAITSDTMYLAKDGTTGTRTLAQYGSATALKLTSTTWLISGSALT